MTSPSPEAPFQANPYTRIVAIVAAIAAVLGGVAYFVFNKSDPAPEPSATPSTSEAFSLAGTQWEVEVDGGAAQFYFDDGGVVRVYDLETGEWYGVDDGNSVTWTQEGLSVTVTDGEAGKEPSVLRGTIDGDTLVLAEEGAPSDTPALTLKLAEETVGD